ncbi:glutathione S-transferase [Alcaligenes sp. SDU_A2]|uniref:glutathione S-transferase n=1 Tax=Alcaligenes sp. SDU_A2 TaxID=3136634 RepID=UPI00311ECD56
MSLSDLPILYSFRRCPYAMRARLAIAVSGTACQLREVVLRDKPESLLQASPKGTVPVVVTTDGKVIAESLDIMRWALTRNDPGRWLQPEQGDASEMLALIGYNDSDFKRDLDRYKYPDRHTHQDDFTDAADYAARYRVSAAQWLLELDARLAKHGYLMGSRPCLADMAIAPFVRQFAQVDRDWFDAQPWPALSAWLVDWLASPLLARIMHKYPAWTPESELVRFPPQE